MAKKDEAKSRKPQAEPEATVAPDPLDLPEGAEVTLRRTAVGPTASQREGRTPTAESVAAVRADKRAPEQELEFAPDDQRSRPIQVDPHVPGAQRAEAIAAQVDASIAQGEGPFLGTGVAKISPPAPAFAPGEPDPSGSHAAGMTARALGAAPPAPTRFDGRDTGHAPRPEVGFRDEVKEGGGEPEPSEPGEPDTTPDLTSGAEAE